MMSRASGTTGKPLKQTTKNNIQLRKGCGPLFALQTGDFVSLINSVANESHKFYDSIMSLKIKSHVETSANM